MKRKRLKEKGITLIALVVTIIILLILAGVAISSVTGDNGLFRKARESVNTYKDAGRDEQGTLGTAENEISKWLNPSGDGGSGAPTGYVEGNTKVTVSDGEYYIPDGFKLASDSGKTINEGIVVEDKNGNQWVWIPCYVDGGVNASTTGLNKYDRYAFSSDGMGQGSQTKLTKEVDGTTVPDLDADGSQKIGWSVDSNYFHEASNSTDEASIRQYGGYYIGRYEAGDGTVTNLETPRLRTSSDVVTNIVTIKKGQAPYNYVTQAQCVTLSNGIAAANNYDNSKMYTKLCSSYAWDTALKFIETRKTEYATFGSTSKIGNTVYGNSKGIEISYTDLAGANQTKASSTTALIPTGQTRAVCNIHDLDGNAAEYNSESCSYEGYSFVSRGGDFYDGASYCPAGRRSSSDGDANVYFGFRPTLFLK